MKRYLFGLGAMIVGAGLMFVLMHEEVRADDYNKAKCEILENDTSTGIIKEHFTYCKIKDLTCAYAHEHAGMSCVRGSMF